MKEKILIIIDPQNDFISGSLAVPGAKECMDALVERLREKWEEIDKVVVTLDWHPFNHCSFDINGGQWPPHCIQHTEGALPYRRLWNFLNDNLKDPDLDLITITKGEMSWLEEYGAFSYEGGKEMYRSMFEGNEIVVTGIMSEYCVLESLKGLVENFGLDPSNISLWLPGIATMDGHKKLKEYAMSNGVNILES